MTTTTNKASPTSSPRPVGTGLANTAIASLPFGAVGLMQSAVAFGPAATLIGASAAGLVGARAVMRTRPLSAQAASRRAQRGSLLGAGGSRRAGGLRAGRLGSRLGGRAAGRSRTGVARHGVGGFLGGAKSGRRPAAVGASRSAASRAGGSRAGGGTGRAGGSRNPLAGRSTSSRSTTSRPTGSGSSRRPGGTGGSSEPSRRGRLRSLLGKVAGGGKRITPGSTSSGGSGRPKPKGKGKGKNKSRRGIVRRALGALFRRASPAARATRKNARRNARKRRRKLYRKLWRNFRRRMVGRPLRPGERWWHRWRIGRGASRAGRGLGLLYRSLRNLALLGAALASITLAAWMENIRRLGSSAGAFGAAMLRALGEPFEGIPIDFARALHEISGVIHPREPKTVPPAPLEPMATRSFDVTDLNIPTNLTPLIEAVQEAGRLGGGEAPHALTVYQWHKDLEKLTTALAELVSADSQLAAETLPVSNSAHEITASFGPALNSLAAEIQEGTEGWISANGTRLERLLDDSEQNKASWDHTTRPDH